MPIDNATVGALDSVSGFLQGFLDGYQKMRYLKMQEYNTFTAPEKRQQWDEEMRRLDADLRQQARKFEVESQKSLEEWRQKTIEPMQTAEEARRGEIGFEQKLKYGPLLGAQARTEYGLDTPGVAERTRQVTEAGIEPYIKHGYVPRGGKQPGAGGGAAGGGRISARMWEQISRAVNQDVDRLAQDQLKPYTRRGRLVVAPEEQANLIAFNPQLRADATQKAYLYNLRPYFSAPGYSMFEYQVSKGRPISDVLSPDFNWGDPPALGGSQDQPVENWPGGAPSLEPSFNPEDYLNQIEDVQKELRRREALKRPQ